MTQTNVKELTAKFEAAIKKFLEGHELLPKTPAISCVNIDINPHAICGYLVIVKLMGANGQAVMYYQDPPKELRVWPSHFDEGSPSEAESTFQKLKAIFEPEPPKNEKPKAVKKKEDMPPDL